MTWDVAVVGAGPAGLAAAIELASVGLSVTVLERRGGDIDKACGEGLMPKGLSRLSARGVKIPPGETAGFSTIRYVQEDGRYVDAELPEPGGLGIRRVALQRALSERAIALGVKVTYDCRVLGLRQDPDTVQLETASGNVIARLAVAADGLHSELRKSLQLDAPAPSLPRRFGMRRHFAVEPWGRRVEVHFAPGVEAYVTPAGRNRVGVAFLWDREALSGTISFEELLQRFPQLNEKLKGAAPDSSVMGAGPLLQRVRRRVRGRVVLLGDAAGYVDAITGEGLALAFEQAVVLRQSATQAMTDPNRLLQYERAVRKAFKGYARLASALVAVARRPRLRRFLLDRLIENPALFQLALHHLSSPSKVLQVVAGT